MPIEPAQAQGAPGAIVADFTRRGRPIDTANGAVAGFVAPGDDDVDWIRNGDFARGWDGWATEGRVALASGESRPDACNGLTAALAPGAAISQRLPFASRPRVPSRAAALTFSVTPAAVDRELRIVLGRDERVVPIPSGLATVGTTLPPPAANADDPVLQIRVPDTATAAIELEAVRLVERSPAGFRPIRPASLAALLAGGSPADPLTLAGGARISLASVVAAARVTTGGETFARVVPQTLKAEDEPRPAIMAHPGSVRPTVVRWHLPAGTCPRHLRASVALAAECRGTSDGVDFAVEAGDRALRVHVPGSGEEQPVALDLDAANATSVPPLDLVLSTTSGAAHDSRCDWALWIEPELSCVGSDREATRAVPAGRGARAGPRRARRRQQRSRRAGTRSISGSSTPTSGRSAPSAGHRPAMRDGSASGCRG